MLQLLFHQAATVEEWEGGGGVSLLHTRKRSAPLKLAPKMRNKGTLRQIKLLHKGIESGLERKIAREYEMNTRHHPVKL